MSLTGYLRKLQLETKIAARKKLYLQELPKDKRRLKQLEKFNNLWNNSIRNIPFYANLIKQKKLPQRFSSWDEFMEKMPVITKQLVQKYSLIMSDQTRKADFWRMTGGTTSQPVQLPAWSIENQETKIDTWMARKWYGIEPDSRLFMIWGHSHLLGTGISGRINALVRMLKDRALGYYRFSAYNINSKQMRLAAAEMIKYRPDYVIGYSVALDAFTRANDDIAEKLRSLKLKAVIGAAEGFPDPDSKQRLGSLFGCPIAMEYGSVETNLLAHTYPGNEYRVFYHSYFIEAIEPSDNGGRVIRITSLYPRCFPLVRYEIGDKIELLPEDEGIGIERFKGVIGRSNLAVELADGSQIHSEVFTHALRDCPGIDSYQVVQTGNRIELLVIRNERYNSEAETVIKTRLEKVHPGLKDVEFEFVDQLEQTLAGKTPMIIRKSDENRH